ncbi:putative wall-associated receptor kinase-like 16 [Mercurialis annua]|uniref:putative wall-associated receptor kinase-like 16 n=1 Tax=Mercurialis annua TaxID=3986 RepID=UPI002160DD95|nr:putative wall-associated receptor kinase-like 16 [Mercurialis annua]
MTLIILSSLLFHIGRVKRMGRTTMPMNLNILLMLLWLNQALMATAARPVCLDYCGDVDFRFPFGIGKGCYMSKSFEVFCNHSFSPPKPFLTSINMELLDSSTGSEQITVNNPVIRSDCSSKSSTSLEVSVSGTPFVFSNYSNRFTAIGCDNYAMLIRNGNTVGGCLSICRQSNTTGCYGLNCCQATIPPNFQSFVVNMTNPFHSDADGRSSCKSAFMVSQTWLESKSTVLNEVQEMDHVPAVLIWSEFQGYCDIREHPNITCTSNYCWAQLTQNQFCICSRCQDVGKCTNPKNYYYCELKCMYNRGSYNCTCPAGHRKISNNGYSCYPNGAFGEKSRMKAIFIGIGSGLGFLLLVISIWLSYKVVKRRRAMKLKLKFFKRNGGLLLEQQLSSTQSHVEQTKVFNSAELEKATDNYHVNRILGQGGQGTVYKGMLTDGRVVAIKKSKVVDEDKLDQFINEVVILSQINHRNVVQLIGCCLETEVPMLVYEFISNGTLFQYIHNNLNEEFPITWEMRLRIATEVAGALAYLHSAASAPIYHRDIKSSNILLDDKYRAKVGDFGTSRTISIEETHVTTRVQGTFGYLDPEYFQSSQFTNKSDVYSFGVVLVELLTGQKPISFLRSVEERSLATYFLLSMEEKRLFEILDSQVLKEGGKKEIIAMAKLAEKCLNLNGKKRPTMKTVAIELEGIRVSVGAHSTTPQDYEEVDYVVGDYTAPWDVASSSSGSINSSTININSVTYID